MAPLVLGITVAAYALAVFLWVRMRAYRYLVACLVARPDAAWRARLAAAATAERDPARLAALADALALAPGDPDLRAALKAVKARQN